MLLSGYWRQLRYGHAECESHACCGVWMRAAPSSEGSVTGPLRWGQLQCGHFVCGNHACRGAWMRAAALSGTAGRIRTLGACSRAATYCENQRFAPVVAWLRAVSSSGGAGWRLALGVILQSRHAPCDNQPIATNVSALNLLRGIPASRTSLGGCGETTPLTGLGQALRTTPTTRPRLSREARRGRCADANCGSDLLQEVRYRGCVKRQRADHVSLER